MGRLTAKIPRSGSNMGKGIVVYQHCFLEGEDRVWVDALDEKKKLMKEDVLFSDVVGRVVWGYRPDGKHVMDEQVWKDLSTRLASYYDTD
jgi:hypothetical protein